MKRKVWELTEELFNGLQFGTVMEMLSELGLKVEDFEFKKNGCYSIRIEGYNRVDEVDHYYRYEIDFHNHRCNWSGFMNR